MKQNLRSDEVLLPHPSNRMSAQRVLAFTLTSRDGHRMDTNAPCLSRPSDHHTSMAEKKTPSPSRTPKSMRRIWACAGALLAATAFADDARLDTLLPSLQQGGYVIVLRHGATDPQQQDVYPLSYEDMTGQRQLSEQGK